MHDVVVIGAGPGGSATACFLAQQGCDVLLLDKASFPRDKTCGDGLTPRALRVLEELGVLDQVTQHGNLLVEATVFAPNGSHVTTRVPVRNGLPSHLLAVPRLALDNILLERAIEAGVRFQGGVRVSGLAHLHNGLEIKGVQQKQPFAAQGRMAVIAVGANVGLLLKLGILSQMPPLILAARTYLEELQHLCNRFEFYFDGVPLPGYGWIFPLSASSANVGVGIWLGHRGERHVAGTAAAALKHFLQLPRILDMRQKARQVGPVKGFPLRTDFASAPTYDERLLLVGEAAGLVNPLTGEGIDLALESGKIAAEHLWKMFASGDFSRARLAQYDSELRARFQRLFLFSGRIRDWYLNERVLNRLVYVARRRHSLKMLFTDIVLGNADAAQGLSLKTILQILFTR